MKEEEMLNPAIEAKEGKKKSNRGRPKKYENIERKNDDGTVEIIKKEIDKKRYFLFTVVTNVLDKKEYVTKPIVSHKGAFPTKNAIAKIFGTINFGVLNIYEFYDEDDYLSYESITIKPNIT